MWAYKSNADDWKQYALFAPHKYTRNLVDDSNGKFNLPILAWAKAGKVRCRRRASSLHCALTCARMPRRSTIHDHWEATAV